MTTYTCGICQTTPDQVSHHRAHLSTQKHKDKKEIFELKLRNMEHNQLLMEYGSLDISNIVEQMETVLFKPKNKTKTKKLQKQYSHDKLLIFQEKLKMREENKNITNREALKEKIHEIHNFMRNNGAGYGMNALKIFNILYGLKKIEDNGLLDQFNFQNCKFSDLLILANNNQDEQLVHIIYNDLLDTINQHEQLRNIMFYEFPDNLKGNVFVYLVKEIEKIANIEKKCNVLLSGKIYEYFIGRDESAISELGAYFTDRHIVDFIINKVQPKVNPDNTLPTMVDMFGGSGGFTTGFIDYINQNHSIDWKQELNKIYHFDMNQDVLKSAGLELFCMTGVFPDPENIKYKNSFADDFTQKYHYILTNPPYGGDTCKKTEVQKKRDKVMNYIKNELKQNPDKKVQIVRQKQLKKLQAADREDKKEQTKSKVTLPMCSAALNKYAKSLDLDGKDKEACSLILMMQLLAPNGTAVGVLKEGVFFNKKYSKLRKALVENFNVREVISVPQDQFENTSTKTSIIVFDNTKEKTSMIKFSEMKIDKFTGDKFEIFMDEIILVENEGDIKPNGVKDVVVATAAYDTFMKNDIFSLNGKDYADNTVVPGKGYEIVNLKDMCEYIKSGKDVSRNECSSGIPYFTSSGIKCYYKGKTGSYNGDHILCGRVGSLGNVIKIKKTFFASSNVLIIKPIMNFEYLHMYLTSYDFNRISNGSVQKLITAKQLKNLQIPIPSPEKMKQWVDAISEPYEAKIEMEQRIVELETMVMKQIQDIGENEECDEMKLGEILTFKKKKNKYNAKDGNTSGKYKFYTSSSNILYRDDYEFNQSHILIGRGGVANIHIASKFSVSHDDVYVLCNATTIKLDFIFYTINNNITKIENTFIGSTIKHTSKSSLKMLEFKIPKNKSLITALNPTFEEIQTLKQRVKTAEEKYQSLLEQLSKEAIM